MDRSTALEMARTKRPGDPEGNPEVALRGGIKNKRAALGVIKGENGTEKAAGKRITRSQSRTKVSTATDAAGAAAEVTAGDTSDAPAKAAATDAGAGAAGNAVANAGTMDVDGALQNSAAATSAGGGGGGGSSSSGGGGAAAMAVPGGGTVVAATGGTSVGPAHINIDAGQSDPHVVVEYVDEIYSYLRGLENKFRPKPGYKKAEGHQPRDADHLGRLAGGGGRGVQAQLAHAVYCSWLH